MMHHGFMLIPWIKVLKLTLQMGGLLQKDKFPNLASTDVITSRLKAVPLSHFLKKHVRLESSRESPPSFRKAIGTHLCNSLIYIQY